MTIVTFVNGAKNSQLLAVPCCISKSLRCSSSVVSRTHLKSPPQQENILQLDLSAALTNNAHRANKLPERVKKNAELNSSHHTMPLLCSRDFIIHAITTFSFMSVKNNAVKLRNRSRLLGCFFFSVVAKKRTVSTRCVVFGHQHLIGRLDILTYTLDWWQWYGSFSSHRICTVARLEAVHTRSWISSVFVCSDIVSRFRYDLRIHLLVLHYGNINNWQRLGVPQ